MLRQPDKPLHEILAVPLQQSWNWPDAAEVAGQCKSQIAINEFMAGGLDRKERLGLFHNVLQAVMHLAPCDAMHWMISGQLVKPEHYYKSKQGEDADPVFPAVNIRMFRIEGRGNQEIVMDSLGLHVFGLPDVQCHYSGLDPNEVARVLGNAALYLFDQGDVVEDGHTIQGIRPVDKWRCQHEVSLIGPEREVLDINPGPPYAAGNRGNSPRYH